MPHPEYLFFQGPLLFSPVWECGHGEAPILRGLVLYILPWLKEVHVQFYNVSFLGWSKTCYSKLLLHFQPKDFLSLSLFWPCSVTCGILVFYQPGIAPTSPTMDAQSQDPLFSLCCKPHYNTLLMIGPFATSLYFFSFLLNYSWLTILC